MKTIKAIKRYILFHLFMWCGTKLWKYIVVSSKNGEDSDAILFSNNESLSEKYSDIEYDEEDS